MKNSDRRSRKTKNTLKQIFIHLLQRKEIEKISVTELCRLADINRSTFYLHYCDIYALLEDTERDCLEEFDLLVEHISSQEIAPDQVTRMILKYIYNQKELLCLFILKSRHDDFWQMINQKVISLFKTKMLQNYQIPKHISEDEFDDMILFYTYGFYVIYRKWLSNNCKEDIDTIVKRTTLFSQTCFDHILIKKEHTIFM